MEYQYSDHISHFILELTYRLKRFSSLQYCTCLHRLAAGDRHICTLNYSISDFATTSSHTCYNFDINNCTVAPNAPSLAAATLNSPISPLTAKPWNAPSQCFLSYPGANLPPPRIASASSACLSVNCWSPGQLLMSNGTCVVAYFWGRRGEG